MRERRASTVSNSSTGTTTTAETPGRERRAVSERPPRRRRRKGGHGRGGGGTHTHRTMDRAASVQRLRRMIDEHHARDQARELPPTIEEEPAEPQQQRRVLPRAQSVPMHAFAARSRVLRDRTMESRPRDSTRGESETPRSRRPNPKGRRQSLPAVLPPVDLRRAQSLANAAAAAAAARRSPADEVDTPMSRTRSNTVLVPPTQPLPGSTAAQRRWRMVSHATRVTRVFKHRITPARADGGGGGDGAAARTRSRSRRRETGDLRRASSMVSLRAEGAERGGGGRGRSLRRAGSMPSTVQLNPPRHGRGQADTNRNGRAKGRTRDADKDKRDVISAWRAGNRLRTDSEWAAEFQRRADNRFKGPSRVAHEQEWVGTGGRHHRPAREGTVPFWLRSDSH